MNRLLRIVFLCLAVLFVLFAALFANYQQLLGESAARNKTVWVALAAAIFFAVGAWRFSFATRAKIFALLLGLLLVEGFLQAAAWCGVLPGVNIKLKAPYARAYWTAEGRGNSICNRYGWHFPEFNLTAPHKVAVIGDSFVEAAEVNRDQNEAADLQRLLQTRSGDWAVLGLGNHGTSPAHHLDVLDYAQRHFTPAEAIIILYLGNDINETLPSLNYVPPASFIYYDLDAAGQLALRPDSRSCREIFLSTMERCHHPLWAQLPATLKSHCMLLQTLLSVKDSLVRGRYVRQMAAANPEATRWARIGLSLKPFTLESNPEQQQAMTILFAELTAIQRKCATNQIKLHFVTVPFFPPQFYAQSGTHWSARLGDYDFLARDREIATFARDRDISFLSFGEWLAGKQTDVKEIQKLYLTGGSGHFSAAGHQLCAQAMYETFYAQPQP